MSSPLKDGLQSNGAPSSPTARARQRLQGAGDQANYMSNHSVLPLLNDLLGTVVENRPDDVLTFLIDYLVQLQSDVTRARQMLERKNKGGGGGGGVVNEVAQATQDRGDSIAFAAVSNSGNTPILDESAILNQILERNNEIHRQKTSVEQVAKNSGAEKATNIEVPESRAAHTKRLIEVRVDGEVRMIPDFEDAEADVHSADSTKQSVPFLGISPGVEPVDSVKNASRSPTDPTSVGNGNISAPSVAANSSHPSPSIIVVQEPIALRYLLKAAERQKTPSLSILVDLGRSKAQAIAAGAGIGPGGAVIPPSTSRSKCIAMAAASNLGLELLQRSSSGDLYQSLSILNNHWMVRKQIVFAVDNYEETTNSNTAAGLERPPAATGNTSPSVAAGRAMSSSSADGKRQDDNVNSVASRSVSPPTHSRSHSPALSSSMPPMAAGHSPPQRMILVQDPTPIRYLLKAAERQHTPTLSLLIDFARKRYGGQDQANTKKPAAIRAPSGSASPGGSPPNDEQQKMPAVTNFNLLGIEILQRSHAKSSGFTSLGFLSNHWMVRRQIVVAVKAKDTPVPSAFAAPPPLPYSYPSLSAINAAQEGSVSAAPYGGSLSTVGGRASTLFGAIDSSPSQASPIHRPSAIVHHQDDLVAAVAALSSSQSPSRCVSPAPK